MKIAFPTQEDQGLTSMVYGHFGSAPCFIIIESDTGTVASVVNRNQNHVHGQCQPIAALGGHDVDMVVVGGIGGGALMKLNAAGVRVFQAIEGTVQENLDAARSGRLPEMSLSHTCAGHSHGGGGGCAH